MTHCFPLHLHSYVNIVMFVYCVKAIPTVFLKSQFEYSRGNYEKAVRMLSSTASHVLNPASSVVHGSLHNAAAMYYNNLGVTHFHMRKHNLGAFYLRRAAEENIKTVREAHNQDGMLTLCLVIIVIMIIINECDSSESLAVRLQINNKLPG